MSNDRGKKKWWDGWDEFIEKSKLTVKKYFHGDDLKDPKRLKLLGDDIRLMELQRVLTTFYHELEKKQKNSILKCRLDDGEKVEDFGIKSIVQDGNKIVLNLRKNREKKQLRSGRVNINGKRFTY